jgi:hypothetical protein
VASALAAPQHGLTAVACPNCSADEIAINANVAFAHHANARIAQTYQAVAHSALPQVPGLAAHQAAEALVYAQQGKVPATNIHRLAEDRVRQAEELLIQLQYEQATGQIYQ